MLAGCDRIQKIRHAGIIGARAIAEVGHRLLQILALLTGEARRRAVTLELIEMASGAADRADNALSIGCHVVRRRRLLQIWPGKLGEVGGKRL